MMRTVVTLTQDEVTMLLAALIRITPSTASATETRSNLLTKLGPFSPGATPTPPKLRPT